MGYYVEWQGKGATRDFWRGFNAAKKKRTNYDRGFRDGKLWVLRGVLRGVQIAILGTAIVVILRGCEILVTLP